MRASVTIDPRLNGPPGSANGGCACGLLARWVEGPAEVTLHVPPPLGRAMSVRAGDSTGVVSLLADDVVVAVARPAAVELDVPAAVSPAEAGRAAADYPWRTGHPYPTCFVCGPDREPGDGLGIFPGPVEGQALYAAPWTPDASLAGEDRFVADPFVWAALDCPSGIVTDRFDDVGTILLGRLTAELRRPVVTGELHVVQAWTLGRSGRKLETASALFTGDGELCAVARAVWIDVAPRG